MVCQTDGHWAYHELSLTRPKAVQEIGRTELCPPDIQMLQLVGKCYHEFGKSKTHSDEEPVPS